MESRLSAKALLTLSLFGVVITDRFPTTGASHLCVAPTFGTTLHEGSR